jgi:hypothetical protein
MPGRAGFLVELRGFEMMASAQALARLAPPLLPVLSLNSVLRPASLPLTYARPAARRPRRSRREPPGCLWRLVSAYDHIDIKRVEFDAAADAAGLVGCDESRA